MENISNQLLDLLANTYALSDQIVTSILTLFHHPCFSPETVATPDQWISIKKKQPSLVTSHYNDNNKMKIYFTIC
jgi:hypothetical protein